MRTVSIYVRSDGTIQSIGDLPEEIRWDGTVTKTRASWVVPVSPRKRFWFMLIRAFFGDEGIVAAWTRNWSGPWIALIEGHPLSFVAVRRQDCISWERDQLALIMGTN